MNTRLMKRSISILTFLIITFCLKGITVQAQSPETGLDWMPIPAEYELTNEKFRINKHVSLSIDGPKNSRLEKYATRFMRRLDQRTGSFFEQGFVGYDEFPTPNPNVVLTYDKVEEVKLGMEESYNLFISENKIELKSATDVGLMRGLETILQMIQIDDSGYYLTGGTVSDQPRFAWRGLMIDVSRHFQPIDVIKRNIDGMAAVKMNILHLHLVDDHGFRVESKVYPQLHEKASDGDYFTQEEVKYIIKYAEDRGIRVVPEFDVPGHATSWLTAFPELSSAPETVTIERRSGIFDPTLDPTNEKTYVVLDGLFTEMSQLFPDEYFHIGGDENEGHHWDANKKIQAFMKKKGFHSNHELQTYFNKRLLTILKRNGKQMMGWDEILHPDLPKETVIHSWQGVEALLQSAKEGRKTVLSNGYYIDLLHPAKDHYLMDPLPADCDLTDEQKKNVLGGETTMWSELVTPLTIDTRIWPRTAAIAERLWSPGHITDVKSMYNRMGVVALQLEEHGLTHFRNREVIMRNLSGGWNIEPVRSLADVASPLQGYHRNPKGEYYRTYSPFTLFADVCIADPPNALKLKDLVDQYLEEPNTETEKSLHDLFDEWQENHSKFESISKQSPILKEMLPMSENLSKIGEAGKTALNKNSFSSQSDQLEWYQSTLDMLENAKEQSGRTELAIIKDMIRFIKSQMAIIPADKATRKVKVDGNLGDWGDATWGQFTPLLHDSWSDPCKYAIQWDKKNLYLAFDVENSNLQSEKSKRDEVGLHMDDGVEFLIDTQSNQSDTWENDDIAYHVNIKNAIIDDRGLTESGEYNNSWNGSAVTAVKVEGTINNSKDTDKGYQVEIAISWKELGVKPQEGLTMGIDLCVNDRDDDSKEYRYFDYMNLNVFHKPSGFAKLLLID